MSLNKTQIEWAKNPDGSQGYTWNPITGCLNHDNGLCKGGGFPCYAYKLAHGRLRGRYLANKELAPPQKHFPDMRLVDEALHPFYPRFWKERLNKFSLVYGQNTARTTPRGIFICDMGELFGDWIPREWQEHIFEVIKAYPLHRFYLLTKQPQNLAKWSPFPDNCWVGVTATSFQPFARGINALAEIEAKIKFISFEPLLDVITSDEAGKYCHDYFTDDLKRFVDWVIIGAQTKPYKPPKIEWVEEIVKAADQAGIPVFIKDNLGLYLPVFPGYYQRQEMPQQKGGRSEEGFSRPFWLR